MAQVAVHNALSLNPSIAPKERKTGRVSTPARWGAGGSPGHPEEGPHAGAGRGSLCSRTRVSQCVPQKLRCTWTA
jgi:hypothetical protein